MRDKRDISWRSRYFRKNFILILLIASIPGIFSGFCLYWFGVGQVEKELTEAHEAQIIDRAKNIDDQLEYLEVLISHWAFDPRYDHSLADIDFVKEFLETRDISKQLLVLQGSNPLIEKVKLYLDLDQPIVFNPNYNVIQDEQEKEFYQAMLMNKPSIQWNRFKNPDNENKGQQLTLSHHVPGISRLAFGAIILTIDQDKLIQLLETLTPYNEGVTTILDDHHDVLVSSHPGESPDLIAKIRDLALQQGTKKGSFSFDWEKETFSVSFGTMKRLNEDWMYISAAPISSITSPIVFISELILVISFSGLILAVIMTWVASVRIYNPLKNLMTVLVEDEQAASLAKNQDEFEIIKENWIKVTSESEKLQQRLSAHIPQLKQSFLLQLRNGYLYDYSEQELRTRMENYGWRLHNQQYLLLDIQLTGIYQFEKDRIENDASLITFTIVNIIEEYGKDYFDQFTVINYHNLSAGVFIIAPLHTPLHKQIMDFSEGVTSIMNDILKLKVTITISETVNEVKKIPYLFENMTIGRQYRSFENMNQIINLQEWNKQGNRFKVFYPFETEREVIQAVRRGQVKETEQLIRKFMNELKEKGIHEINIQPGIIQLFSTIQHEILHSSIHPNELFGGRNMFEELSDIREPEWMIKWIIDKVISPYVQLLEGQIDIEMKRHIEKIVEFINNHYMEDISLESCADVVGTTPYTLSKAFKKILNINFIDYVTDIRINHAKELLLNTNMKIQDISESVGYRHSYFNRIFKKQVGVTPSQFRKMNSSG
ncbi:AraC family transcriptional regulator [Lederbergia sp. NSJ-179]|uniref:AraC family transcriptional regulator n=1 Tax=Lederbergia sp. NSJ-179 TaxID=2931402 RepID=UPI001FD3238C|nr:AraC family transcriptional regulator [Lederbergia sp. NSJ-179]MCJ7840847.1 AraC family transcriptional regulator [Lederbergia sp. NSJ-179]